MSAFSSMILDRSNGGGPFRTLVGHQGTVLCIRFSRTGAYCLTGGKDRSMRLWNPTRGTLVAEYTGGHAHDVRSVACSGANDRIASCGGDRQVFLYDVQTGRIVRKFRGHDARNVNAVSFADKASDSVVFSGGYDATVRAWDCRSSSIDAIQVLKDFKDSVTSLVVHEYDVIAASVDGSVRTFDVRTGEVVTDTLGPPVTCVNLSSDAQCILAGLLESKIALLDRGSGELLAQYKGHANRQFKVESLLTHDDAYVVSGSEDGKVYFWDLVESEIAESVQVNPSGAAAAALAWHPQGDCLVTAEAKGDVHVWKCAAQ